MTQASTLLGVLGGGVGLLVVVGAIVVYLRASWDKGDIDRLNQAVASRDARITGLELDVERHEATIKAQGLAIVALERENKTLKHVRPSAEAIAMIERLITDETNPTVKAILQAVTAEEGR